MYKSFYQNIVNTAHYQHYHSTTQCGYYVVVFYSWQGPIHWTCHQRIQPVSETPSVSHSVGTGSYFCGTKLDGEWSWPLTPFSTNLRILELHLHSSIFHHGEDRENFTFTHLDVHLENKVVLTEIIY